MAQRHAMTLIELLVVLTILALLTTVAVTSSDVVLGQGRYDATTRTLTEVQEAVLGPPNARQADGTLVYTGFVADMGRLPLCTGPGLSELWMWNSTMTSWTLQSPNDTDVAINLGWHGPYLRLPPGMSGQTPLCDGWGNPFNLLNLAGNPTPLGGPIVSVVSGGAGSSGNSAYNVPLLVNLLPPQITVSGYVYLQDSGGSPANPGGSVQVWMYCPNIATGALAELQCTTTTSGTGVVGYGPPYTPAAGAAVPGVNTTGLLRAYLGDRTATRRSAVVQFQRSSTINLNIQ